MTIAYSDKYNMWTTRYSFEPNCYGTVGNTMISSKGGGIWKHDVNDSRCSFYGLAQGCSLEVASNRDPSAIKSFNSISLETNSSDWQATVFTNDEYSSNQAGRYFTSREVFNMPQYVETQRTQLKISFL